jgi:AcrR family transcriptional regulator
MDNMKHDGLPVKGHRLRGALTAAERGVAAAEKGLAAAEKGVAIAAAGVAKADGRKRRWDEHKRARREEFVEAALAAIRREGPGIGMEAIAAELEVSKTVLYRHFTDKSDLIGAVLTRIAATVLLPALIAELKVEREDVDQARAVIRAYVESVASEPELYAFVFAHNNEVGDTDEIVATTERMVAEALASLIGGRLRAMRMDSGGAEVWAYGIIGMVQLATHWWVDHRTMSTDALVDYLTMLAWGGLDGVLRAGGSPAAFARGDDREPALRLLGGIAVAATPGHEQPTEASPHE